MKTFKTKLHMSDGNVVERVYTTDNIQLYLDILVVSKRTTFITEPENVMYPHTSIIKITYELINE